MNVLLTGASGLIGSAAAPALESAGHRVVKLRRDGGTGATWNPEEGKIDLTPALALDAVIHLAGESIGARWTAERKRRIRESRVAGTRLLSQTLAKLPPRPKVLVCASATGYYGDRGDEVLRESSPPGSGFLSEVCREWEAATTSAAQKGIRVVTLRIGVILSSEGGALARMLFPFKLGLGGKIGTGAQYMSWIAMDDVVRVIARMLTGEGLRGPVNTVAPHPVTNLEFTKALGRVLGRLTPFPVPAFAARLAFGEMADALLLASTRVEPRRLAETGYPFRFPELEGALRHLLGKA